MTGRSFAARHSRGDGLPERRGEATFAARVTAGDYYIFVSEDDFHAACFNCVEIKPDSDNNQALSSRLLNLLLELLQIVGRSIGNHDDNPHRLRSPGDFLQRLWKCHRVMVAAGSVVRPGDQRL